MKRREVLSAAAITLVSLALAPSGDALAFEPTVERTPASELAQTLRSRFPGRDVRVRQLDKYSPPPDWTLSNGKKLCPPEFFICHPSHTEQGVSACIEQLVKVIDNMISRPYDDASLVQNTLQEGTILVTFRGSTPVVGASDLHLSDEQHLLLEVAAVGKFSAALAIM